MILILQRVKSAQVTVEGKISGKIGKGFLILIGFSQDDLEEDVEKMAFKIRHLRVFEDNKGKMNLSIKNEENEILCIPNFTLCASLRKGRRPSFDKAMEPDKARKYFEIFVSHLRNMGIPTRTGVFGARMEVSLVNDGPVTFVLTEKDLPGEPQ